MKINGFKCKGQKIQKLWLILVFSFLVAIFLIGLAFYFVFTEKKEEYQKGNEFEISSYYTKYQMTTYANKNQNTYELEEYCMEKEEETKIRINTLNQGLNFSYIMTNDHFAIRSDGQISYFDVTNYLAGKDQIFSVHTFFALLKKINTITKSGNVLTNEGVKLLVKEQDQSIIYQIELDVTQGKKGESSFKEYQDTLFNGMKLTKLELIFDKESRIPQSYLVYTNDDKAYLEITYQEFKINPKIEEKVFSFS